MKISAGMMWLGKMKLITEKRNAQDGVIYHLQAISWEYIPPADIQEKRGHHFKEPSILKILEKKLKELNPGIKPMKMSKLL